MLEYMIRVKRVKHFNEETKFAVFTAMIYKQNKRNKNFKETTNVQLFTGKFMSVHPNDKYMVHACEIESVLYGHEYKIVSHHRLEPGTIQEIRSYLINIQRIGPVSANKIIDKYGLDTISEIRANDKALDGFGLTETARKNIRQDIMNTVCFEKILDFLLLHDLDCRYAIAIFKRYGETSLAKMKDNPYSLYLDNILDFTTADKLNSALGYAYNTAYRVETSVLACLRNDSESCGNIYMAESEMPEKLKTFLKKRKTGYGKAPAFSAAEIDIAITKLKANRYLSSENDRLYLTQNKNNEETVVQGIKKLMTGIKHTSYPLPDIVNFISDYEKTTGFHLADKQKDAVITALKQPVSILTGGPGTGKTQTLSAVIKAIRTLSPKSSIQIAAPTGKAALRVSELTGLPASTIHRLLKVGRWSQELGEDELVSDFLIIDEFSMVDCELCARLLRATRDDTRLVIVGDFEQLPSVGPGLVLRDLIASDKIVTTKLTEIFRQKGQNNIVQNANAIVNQKEGQPIHLKVDKVSNKNFYFVQKESAIDIQDTIKASIRKLLKEGYTQDNIKVLTPLHGTEIGTDVLNSILQAEFNPTGEVFEYDHGKEFRIGDPVIHIHNDYDIDVFNGETGVVKAFGYDADKTILVEFPTRVVWYNISQVDELELAYAMTVHKAQGSEFKVVIMPVHEMLLVGLSKNLIYTAFTRAKEKVVIVGSTNALSIGMRQTTDLDRKSYLSEKLKAAC